LLADQQVADAAHLAVGERARRLGEAFKDDALLG
jgi:hypothetical protein